MTRTSVLLLAVCAIAAGVYLNTLRNGFALDDEFVVLDNPDVHGLDVLPSAVTGPYWPKGRPDLGMYRPVPLATFALDWELWNGRPLGFHLANILLHAAASGLVLLLLLGLGAAPLAAAGGAALFAVHPVHVEAVANVVGRAELLAALFYIGGCLAYLRLPSGWGRAAAVAVLYLLSLLSKEIGVTLPGALVLLHMARSGTVKEALREAGRQWRVYAALSVALLLYFVLRWINIGTLLGGGVPPWFWLEPAGVRVLTGIRVIPEYLRLMLFPAQLSADYGPAVILPERTLGSPLVLAGVLTAVGAGVVAVLSWKRIRLLSLGIVWFAGTVLPVSGIPFTTGFILAERTLYLPSVGVALAAAGILGRLEWGEARVRRWAVVVMAGLLLLGGARTWTYNRVWRSTETVLDHLIRTQPANYRSQWIHATRLEHAGDTAAALDHLALATRLVPGYYGIREHYGQLLQTQGAHAAAAAQFDTALMIFPDNPLMHIRLLEALRVASEHGRAAEAAAVAVARFPRDPVFHHLHAQALRRAGSPAAAREARLQALRLDRPENRWGHWVNVAALELLLEEDEAAVTALDSARAHAPEGTPVPSYAALKAALVRGETAAIPLW